MNELVLVVERKENGRVIMVEMERYGLNLVEFEEGINKGIKEEGWQAYPLRLLRGYKVQSKGLKKLLEDPKT